jgi:hypothetical protein
MAGIFLAVALLLTLLGSLWGMRGYRRRLPIFAEWQVMKSRLPQSVKRAESLILYGIWVVLFPAAMIALHAVYFSRHTGTTIDPGVSAVLSLSAAAMTWPLAALGANAVSYLIASLRRASRAALAGLQVATLRRANIELCVMAVATAALCAPFVALAILTPWAT